MTYPHPFVTVYKSDEGPWRATWMDPATKKLKRVTFRDWGILTHAGREAWSVKKSNELLAERRALVRMRWASAHGQELLDPAAPFWPRAAPTKPGRNSVVQVRVKALNQSRQAAAEEWNAGSTMAGTGLPQQLRRTVG